MRSIFIHKMQTVAAILLVTMSVSIAGCSGADTDLESRITDLERELSRTKSTVEALEDRIEELETAPLSSLTEADVLRILQGKTYWVNAGGQHMLMSFGQLYR